ncbi:hypothetical protein F5Y03DRAFT_341710 [Xylaria venustula]|nr:hypothetical protein F5Y03DRAFT_341710 [Xylaria venustula]
MSISKWKFSSSRKHSTSSSGNSDTPMTSSSTTTRPSSPTNPSSTGDNSNRSSKTSLSSSPFSWFRSPHRSKKRKSTISSDDPAFKRLHKPFTPQNLEHQKMLSAFEWNFGSSDDDGYRRRRQSSLSISPCATRNMTVDDYGYGPEERFSHQDALSRSLACLSTREDPGDANAA